MQVRLRNAQAADLPLVLELMQAYYAFDHLPFDRPKATTALRGLLDDDRLGRVWVILADDAAAGYIVLTLGYSLEYQGRDAFVDEVYLREAYRRQGVGRQVMALVEGECRALAVRALHLEVERENRSAQAFYRTIGFEDHDRYLMSKWIG